MAETPASLGRRYLPFIAVALVQVLLVAVAPSRGLFGSKSSATGSANDSVAAGGAAVDANGNPVTGGGTGVGVGGTGSSAGGGGGASGAGATAGGAAGAAAGGTADLSHCDKDKKEIGPPGFTGMPPCVPVWHGGDNGGSTMPGVDATHVRYVLYKAMGNAEVNQILGTQGLAATDEQACEAYESWDKVVNKRYEAYGRKFVSLDGPSNGGHQGSTVQSPCSFPYFQGQCALTPPDPVCERAEAKVIAAMKPAIVLAGVADTAFYDELSKDHVMVIGGGGAPESYYDEASPYYYGLLMDGTRQASFDSEYWCKKLNGKPTQFAGQDVMTGRNWGATIGQAPVRKIAVIYPENNGDEVTKLSVDNFKARISGGRCTSPGGVLTIPYKSDINTAQQQSVTTVQALIDNHITTVACWCDLIAPVFLTQNMAKQGYFPEQFVLGVGLLDYDVLGRLYDQSEWIHAFGVSDLNISPPFTKSGAQYWWNDAGKSGSPDGTQNAVYVFWSFMGAGFQMAGPKPTPEKFHQALMALPVSNKFTEVHDPTAIQVGFKPPSPYTAAEDTREINWNPSRSSEVDGKAGAYCPIDKGHRYDLEEWPTGNPDVFDTNTNGC